MAFQAVTATAWLDGHPYFPPEYIASFVPVFTRSLFGTRLPVLAPVYSQYRALRTDRFKMATALCTDVMQCLQVPENDIEELVGMANAVAYLAPAAVALEIGTQAFIASHAGDQRSVADLEQNCAPPLGLLSMAPTGIANLRSF